MTSVWRRRGACIGKRVIHRAHRCISDSCSTQNPSIQKTAILVASMWRETLGVETKLAKEEYRVFLQSRHDKSRSDVVGLAWTADFNDASNFLETFRAHSSNNDSGYVNPQFDELLDGAESSAESSRRREFLERSERVMLADYPAVPLFFMVSKRMIKPYAHGVVLNPLNHIRSQSLALQARLPANLCWAKSAREIGAQDQRQAGSQVTVPAP
jgi:ABC-type oligopeptide transport system substrate-binding subunit